MPRMGTYGHHHAVFLQRFGAHRPEVPVTGIWANSGPVETKRPKTTGVAFGVEFDPDSGASFVVVSSWMADFGGRSGWIGDESSFKPELGDYTSQTVSPQEARLAPPRNPLAANAVRSALANNQRLRVPIRLLWKHHSKRPVPVSRESARLKAFHPVTLAHYAGLKLYGGEDKDGLHLFTSQSVRSN